MDKPAQSGRSTYRAAAKLGSAWKMTCTARCFTRQLVRGLTREQLLAIPRHCDTNVLWELGHLTFSLDRMLYPPAGLTSPLPNYFHEYFRPGVTSLDWRGMPDLDEVLGHFDAQLQRVQADLENGCFRRYVPVRIDEGVKVSSLKDALAFNAAHEGFHAGTISAMLPLVLAA